MCFNWKTQDLWEYKALETWDPGEMGPWLLRILGTLYPGNIIPW